MELMFLLIVVGGSVLLIICLHRLITGIRRAG